MKSKPLARGPIPYPEQLTVAISSLLFTYVFFIEYLPPFTQVHLWSDIAGYHYPLQEYAFAALKHHRIPLWDASIYCGMSFVGNLQAAMLYPPTWLMYLASGPSSRLPFKALEIFTFAHIWLAFFLAYLWFRNRVRLMASLLGAATFAYSGFLMWLLLHPGVLCAASWMPLGLWGIDQAAERRDWRPLWKIAAASALSFLAGYPAAWLVNCILFLVYAVAGKVPRRVAVATCGALGASVLLIMAQLLPALDARSLMFLEPKYGPGAWGWRQLLAAYFLPNWFDFNPGHATDYEPGCFYLYIGLPALVAVGWLLWRHQFRRYIQPLAAGTAMLLLANPPKLLIRLVERVPALEDTMQPSNFYSAIGAMVALTTALALDHFLAGRGNSTTAAPPWVLTILTAFVTLWSGYQLRIWLAKDQFPSHGFSILAVMISVSLMAGWLWAFRAAAGRGRIVAAATVLALAGVDFKVYGSGRWFNAQDGDADAEYDAIGMRGMSMPAFEVLSSNRSYRILCDENGSPYSTDLRMYNLATPQGFDPFLTTQYRQRIERWVPFRTNRLFFIDPKDGPMLQSLGVRYVITHEGAGHQAFLAASPDFKRISPDESFYQVYEYLHAVAPYGWEDHRTSPMQIVAWKPERREFLVQSDRPGRFVLVEQFFPGWAASIDRRPAPIERWDSAFQAIDLPAGRHRVKFLFRPRSTEIGAVVSLTAAFFLLLVVRSDWRVRKNG